ncbi:aldo/keto reductase, partial [Rhizobium leguminosarum]|uniref:aldo/keto reductase n=1 Tax=Rhizobium leguminosarum TaxID=384 RepID=UPI003F9971E6
KGERKGGENTFPQQDALQICRGEKPNDRGASRGHIRDSVEASLKRLQTDHIDLYQIHATDPVGGILVDVGDGAPHTALFGFAEG